MRYTDYAGHAGNNNADGTHGYTADVEEGDGWSSGQLGWLVLLTSPVWFPPVVVCLAIRGVVRRVREMDGSNTDGPTRDRHGL